ncbi:hypothetical protein [Paenibacillus shenyangensis]|nr:hypothetical protein [Paenibacillus sp. A9]
MIQSTYHCWLGVVNLYILRMTGFEQSESGDLFRELQGQQLGV